MTKDEINLTNNFINKDSPLAKQQGQDSYSFDARLLDTKLNSGNFSPAGQSQNIQFNNNGTLAGRSSLSFNAAGGQLSIGSSNFDGQIISPASLQISPAQHLYLTSGTGGDLHLRTNGGDEHVTLGTSETTFNINSNDFDVRFKGSNDPSLLFIDAGSNQVGVGVDTPQAKFDINGLISIRGGNPGIGRYLVSDANGIGTWIDLPGASGTIPVDQNGGTVNLIFINGLFQGTS